MAKLLLIGPQLAGKTTFLNSARNRVTPEKNPPTVKPYDVFWSGVKIGGVSGKIVDTNGSTTIVLNNKETLHSLMNNNDCVAFVFNGKEFYKEVSTPQKPGEISNIIKNLVLPVWAEVLQETKDKKQLFFLANVSQDPHEKEFYVEGDARTKIIAAIKISNEEYSRLAKHQRYPFINYFESNNFYCIDATDFIAVQKVGNTMLKAIEE